jgi:PAS domain S-box-containing protein
MAIDIDQKVRAQQALEEKNAEVAGILENLKAIINNTSDLIWSIDQDFRIISANEAFYKRMELITGKRITQIDHRDFPEETQRKWIGFYERGFKGESFKTVWHEQLPDLDLYEEVSLNPIIGPEGNILGLSCIARNVNDSYLYTRKIEEQNKQLRNIAWIQSHEVRAPLADILGLVSLMKQGLLAEQEQARMIGMLDEAARKLDTVIVRTVRQTHNEG